MGSFKERGRSGLGEIRERSGETTEQGSEMTEQAAEIRSVLDGIELQDEEDIRAVDDTERAYQSSFDGAFHQEVEEAGQEIQRQGEQLKDTMGDELERVRSGISSMEQAGGISEIGRDAAEAGRSRLEGSAGEYQDIITETEQTSDETQQKIESLKSRLGSIFG